ASTHGFIYLFTTGKVAVTAVFRDAIEQHLQQVAVVAELLRAKQNAAGANKRLFALGGFGNRLSLGRQRKSESLEHRDVIGLCDGKVLQQRQRLYQLVILEKLKCALAFEAVILERLRTCRRGQHG